MRRLLGCLMLVIWAPGMAGAQFMMPGDRVIGRSVTRRQLQWFVPGLPASGSQVAHGIVPEYAVGCTITNTRIAIGTVAAASGSWNVERCPAAKCQALGTPAWVSIYTTAPTLANSSNGLLGGAPNVATIAAGDHFRAIITPGAGTGDYTVSLEYRCAK